MSESTTSCLIETLDYVNEMEERSLPQQASSILLVILRKLKSEVFFYTKGSLYDDVSVRLVKPSLMILRLIPVQDKRSHTL